jgi:hypothetical protein
MSIAYEILVIIPEEKRSLGKLRYRWEKLLKWIVGKYDVRL